MSEAVVIVIPYAAIFAHRLYYQASEYYQANEIACGRSL